MVIARELLRAALSAGDRDRRPGAMLARRRARRGRASMRDLDVDAPGRDCRALLRGSSRTPGARSSLGITGNPGAGKSTVVDALIAHYRAAGQARRRGRGRSDLARSPAAPSSATASACSATPSIPASSSARSPPAATSAACRARPATWSRVLDAMGFDVVLIETVGVGPGRGRGRRAGATPRWWSRCPGLGDDIQAIKAGILEIADVLVVNKAIARAPIAPCAIWLHAGAAPRHGHRRGQARDCHRPSAWPRGARAWPELLGPPSTRTISRCARATASLSRDNRAARPARPGGGVARAAAAGRRWRKLAQSGARLDDLALRTSPPPRARSVQRGGRGRQVVSREPRRRARLPCSTARLGLPQDFADPRWRWRRCRHGSYVHRAFARSRPRGAALERAAGVPRRRGAGGLPHRPASCTSAFPGAGRESRPGCAPRWCARSPLALVARKLEP